MSSLSISLRTRFVAVLTAVVVSLLMEYVGVNTLARAGEQVFDKGPSVIKGNTPQASAADYFHPYVTYPVGDTFADAVAIGDLNNDGLNDVALTTDRYVDSVNDFKLFVFLQDGAGGLQAPVHYPVGGSDPASDSGTVDVGDLNGDGRDDVVVGRNNGSIFVLLQNVGGTLNPGVSYGAGAWTYRVRIGDFNSDGRADVVSIGPGSGTRDIVIHTQHANGGLVRAATYVGIHQGFDDLEVADLNGDGRDDLVIVSGVSYGPHAYVLLQQPEGLFGTGTPYSLGLAVNARGVGAGDLNGDGGDDLGLSYGGNQPDSHIGLWFQNSSGALSGPMHKASYDIPVAMAVADADSDLRADVMLLHRGWQRFGVYRQQADGTLADEDLFPIPVGSISNPHSLAVGDVNGDGANDAVIAVRDAGLVVLLQKPPAPTGVSASPLAESEVHVTWKPFAGAAIYEVYRRASGGSYVLIGTSPTASFLDTSVTAGEAYAYRVRASSPERVSDFSPSTLATVVRFTDDPLVQGSTPLKALHLQELRTAVSAVRTLAGLPAATFTDEVVTGVTARAVHFIELRTALDEAYRALSIPLFAYSAPIVAGLPIKAMHVQELRARLN